MDPQVPGSEGPEQGLDYDAGESLEEWSTRWSELKDARGDDEAEALDGVVDLLDEMYREVGVPESGVDNPGTEELPRILEEVRDVNRRLQADEPVPTEELDDAWRAAREGFDYLVRGQELPDPEV